MPHSSRHFGERFIVASWLRNIWLISKTIWIEAIRRREIYVIVVVAMTLIALTRLVDFFDIEGLAKFHREISLKTMGLATSLTIILLTARQLPREFRNRTLYPLLARPVGRLNFLLGKFVGVMLAGAFCYAIFIAIFLIGQFTTGTPLNLKLFSQFVYLQMWSFAVLASLAFLLSLMFNVDAAVTLCTLLYLCSQFLMGMMSYLYDFVGAAQRWALIALHYVIPQLTLFDASGKVVHSSVGADGAPEVWPGIAPWALGALTLYGAAYTIVYLTGAWLLFRRRPL